MQTQSKLILTLAMALGCGSTNTSRTATSAESDPSEYFEGVKIGLATVDGLPGTPTELGPHGIPLIDGVERRDYLPEGINSWDKRAARVTDDNPTGEMRFNMEPILDATGAEAEIFDAPDISGFVNGQERYNYCLLHDCPKQGAITGTHSAAWTSDIFFGNAFSADPFGAITLKGACWAAANVGLDCEFPNVKNMSWGFSNSDGGAIGGACAVAANHGIAFPFYNNPVLYAQSGFDAWSPAGKTTPISAILPSLGVPLSTGNEQITVDCPVVLPGSQFGAVMARSGPISALTLKTPNIPQRFHETYPNCTPPSGTGALPRDFYQFTKGEIEFDAGNMYDRSVLCGADQNSPDMLKFIAMNTFAHERGHIFGFFHFSTGVMQQQGNCSIGYTQFRGVPAAFQQVLNNYVGGGSTFSLPASSDACTNAPTHRTPLPAPLPNSTGSVFGRLEE